MGWTNVACNHCGAPLQVPEDARFVTCNYCSSQLAVERSETATFTRKLEEVAERTERLEEDVSELQYRQQLEELEQSWQRERETYMISDRYGHRRVPTVAGSVFGRLMVVAFGIFWTAMAANIGERGLCPLRCALPAHGPWHEHLMRTRRPRTILPTSDGTGGGGRNCCGAGNGSPAGRGNGTCRPTGLPARGLGRSMVLEMALAGEQ